MTGKDLLRQIRQAAEAARLDYTERQAKGSHLRVHVGTCRTTVPLHAGQDLPPGTLRAITRDLEPCLGRGWRA